MIPMDQARARALLTTYVKDTFGRVVELREVFVARRAAGRSWVGNLYCVTRIGEVKVGRLELDDDARWISQPGVDELVAALQRSLAPQEGEDEAPGEDRLDLSDVADAAPAGDDDDDLFGMMDALEEPSLREQIDGLLAGEDRDGLLEARRLLPRLLAQPETRGQVLREMGELELRLDELNLGLSYLEAAAGEFADGADLDALGQISERTLELLGPVEFVASPVKTLLERARARITPIEGLRQARALSRLPEPLVEQLQALATEVVLGRGQDAITEATEAREVFVVRSGHLSIRLETPTGDSQRVRCCFPGDLVGESAVLRPAGSTCTATVRAESLAHLWRFEGAALRELTAAHPELREALETSNSLHRLDSFFSMNEALAALDVRVRDRILGCVRAVRRVREGERLARGGEPPPAVFLVVEGAVQLTAPHGTVRRFGRDSFAGLHDALHGLPLEGDLVAVEPSRLVCFDGDRLRELAAESPPEVVAALERLE